MYHIVPSIGLEWRYSDRYGRYIQLPKISGSIMSIKTMKEKCINTEGAKLFNSLPKILINFDGEFKDFKNLFDIYMCEIPDCPVLPGYVTHNLDDKNNSSNSLVDWNRNLNNIEWTPERSTKQCNTT